MNVGHAKEILSFFFPHTLGNHAHTDGRIQMLDMRDFSTEK